MSRTISQLYGRLANGANNDPLTVRLLPGHVGSRVADGPYIADEQEQALVVDEDYLQVTLCRARLAHGRRWWTDVVPMVYVMSSFDYGGVSGIRMPVVVGPSAFRGPDHDRVPDAVAVRDVPLVGPHPFRGGRIALTVVLYEVPVGDVSTKVLNAVTTTAAALPIGPALAAYLPLAGAVVTGVNLLLDVGDTRAVAGCHHGTQDGRGAGVSPGTFALVVDAALRPDHLWVVNGDLMVGAEPAGAVPVTTTDYVLYSLQAVRRRDDALTLPFVVPLRERMVRLAASAGNGSWDAAKTALSTLAQELYLSPDLVRGQAQELYVQLRDEALALHARSEELVHLGPGDGDVTDELLRNINDAVLHLG